MIFRTLNNRLWRNWLGREHRCIVPASAFADPDRNTAKPPAGTCFERAEKPRSSSPRSGRHRPAIARQKRRPRLTTVCSRSLHPSSNAVVAPVHEKAMPVMLMTDADIDRWLKGSTVEEALELQKTVARGGDRHAAAGGEGGVREECDS